MPRQNVIVLEHRHVDGVDVQVVLRPGGVAQDLEMPVPAAGGQHQAQAARSKLGPPASKDR